MYTALGRPGAVRVGRRTGASRRVGRLVVAVALAAALLTLPGIAAAAVPFPATPNDGWDTNGDVFAVKVVGSTVYVGGSFTTVRAPGNGGSVARANLAAFDMLSGEVLPFVADTDNTVRAIESDGTTVWVGGNFSTIGGVGRSGLAALDAPTGDVQGMFDVSNNGAVYALALGGGRLYAGGYFTTIAGVTQQRVASLDPATGLPDPGFQAAANESARGVVVSDTGRLFVGGGFTTIGGADRSYLAELDPHTGTTIGPGFDRADDPILDVDVTPDGSLVFAAVAGGQNRAQAWSTFDGSRRWYHQAMGDTQAVAYYDGVLYFGFHEGFADDLTVRLLASNVLTGELEDFRPAVDSFFGVWALDANSNGLAVGGEFRNISGVGTRGIAVFPGDGSQPDTRPPAAPFGLINPEPSGEEVMLEWSVPQDDRGVSYYRVFRDGALIAETLDPQHADWAVEENTEYIYEVQASDLAGNLSPLSEALVVRTWTNLVAPGEPWRHTDAAQVTAAWRDPGFDDSSWQLGDAELGFGDGGEATALTPGSISYYFRKTVAVPDNHVPVAARLGLMRDDGAVVYVNGEEVYRSNMPDGVISPTTRAVDTAAGSEETRWFEADIDPDLFLAGANVIAVEVHQRSLGSSDVSFDLRMDISLIPQIFDEESPSRPRRLRAVAKRATRVRLSWDAASDNVAVGGYRIDRDGEEVGFSTDLIFRDDGLWPETEYTYKVYAIDTAGNSSVRSRVRSATTLADEDPPTRPRNVTWSVSPTAITVEWDPAGDNVAVSHYIVKSSGKLLAITTDTSFVYSALEPDTDYSIVLRAVDVFGNKSARKRLWITTPPA